ncbi:hypothetical protein U2I54_17565 [Bacillus pseudomycoides]|uniref:Uncharacterized protein n=1 Tax=Bacillus bingmayongensis TaxID=1150157 RepID=A0ABU5JZF1_9BACI|nr:hypothetical protein [Bacillus pseudomycoides]
MQEMGKMTKGFISNYLAEGPIIINSRYTFSLPLYTIGILFMELLEKGYLQLNQNDEIEIRDNQDTNHVHVNQLMLYIQNYKRRTCKEWICYFGEKSKVTDEIFMSVVKEMEQEGTVRYRPKKIFSFIVTQVKVEYVEGANTFVDYIQKDLLLKKKNKFEMIVLLWKYYYGAYMNEQEISSLQKEQNIYRFVQQIQEGVLEGAQRNIVFV